MEFSAGFHLIASNQQETEEFVEAFGIFFFEWFSYHYLQMDLEEENIFNYGDFGKHPVLIV